MKRPLSDQTIVIIGASSGIGRQTALDAARRGAAVVLAARNEEALRDVEREITSQGGRAKVVPCDVSRWEDVQRLAREAESFTGRIDTWVNDAAVSVYGLVSEVPVEDMEQVIQTDLMGQIYGAKAVLPILRRQGEGTIIFVSSVVGKRAIPLQAAYCAAKHGIVGFADALRMEEEHEKTGVHVTVIYPSSINTPFFNNAKSYMGVKPQPIPPVYPPEEVSHAILHAAEHRHRHLFVGGMGKFMGVGERISPRAMDKMMTAGGNMFRQQQTDEPEAPIRSLRSPRPGRGRVHGDFDHMTARTSAYTRGFELHPEMKTVAVGALAAGVVAALVAGQRRPARRRTRNSWDGRP